MTVDVPRIARTFATEADFLAAYEAEVSAGGLLVRGASVGSIPAMAPCVVVIRVAELQPIELPALVASARPGAVAVIFDGSPEPLHALAREIRRPRPTAPAGERAVSHTPIGSRPPTESRPPIETRPLAERLSEMSVGQKIQLAMNGDREARILLLRDQNKTLHSFVLKNVRIQLEEVQFAARLPTLAPDALKFISENLQWMATPSILIGLVRNPTTPIPVALKLIPRVPLSELRAIAKGGARLPLVQAARRLIARG